MQRSDSSMVAMGATLAVLLTVATPAPFALSSEQANGADRGRFVNGLPSNPTFFPIAVWLQSPRSAPAYKAIGINTFVGLWQPPTAADLAMLESEGLYLIVEQTLAALALGQSPAIRGWLHIDEPDNAQPNGKGGYGDCIPPEELVRRYHEMRARDSTRPIYLGFGQAVANPLWHGRGPKCSAVAPEAYYKKASEAANIIAFDIYPAVEVRQAHVRGRLDLVGRGVANLKRWAPPGTPVWADIETTHIHNPARRPLPEEVFSEVWIAIINGASGINYFVHEWKPSFREDGVFRYPDVSAAIKKINAQITELAPVLNSASVPDALRTSGALEIAVMAKRQRGALYIFAANMEKRRGQVRFDVAGRKEGRVIPLDEDRSITLSEGIFEDSFEPYGIHIYRLPAD
jgi:hypothetical protein